MSAILLGALAAIALSALAGCGGNGSISKSSTPQVTIAISKAAPATLAPGATASVAATVSNDKSGMGVTWSATCPAIYGTYPNDDNECGGFNGRKTGTSASGADITYNAPAAFPGGTVTLMARATANVEAVATTTLVVPPNITMEYVNIPSGSVTAATSTSVSAKACAGSNCEVLYNDSIVYSLSCPSTLTGGCGTLNGSTTVKTQNDGTIVGYTAPPVVPTGGTVTITATLADDPSATISAVTPIGPPIVSAVDFYELDNGDGESIHMDGNLQVGKAELIAADVQNDLYNAGVDWTVTCADPGGNCGTLSSAHTLANTSTINGGTFNYTTPNAAVAYTAPSTLPPGGTVTITAASTTAPSVTTSATLTVTRPNANGVTDALNGQFAYYFVGRDTNYDTFTSNTGGAFAIAGSFIGTGKGTFVGGEADFIDYNLGLSSGFGYGGSYTMTAGGQGQIAIYTGNINVGTGLTGVVFNVSFIDEDHALLSGADGFSTGTGMLYRQNVKDIATATTTAGLPLSGAYTLSMTGASRDNPNNRFFLNGALNVTAGSGGTSTETSFVGDVSYEGTSAIQVSAATHPTLGSSYNTLGRTSLGAVDLGAKVFNYGTTSIQTLTAYMVDKSHYLVLQRTDNELVAVGQLIAQPSSSTLSGSYAFTEAGMTAANVPVAAGGVFTCGSTGTMDVATLGGAAASKESITAACVSPANGRGTITLTGTTGGIGKFAAYPTVDSNLQLVEIDNGGPYGSGVALPQTTTAITAASFKGNYAGNLFAWTSGGVESLSGQLTADGASALTGTAGVSQFNLGTNTIAPSPNVTLTGAYTADASGRFPGTLNLATATAQSLGSNYYYADANNILYLSTDAANPATGVLKKQALDIVISGTTAWYGQVGVGFSSTAPTVQNGIAPYSYSVTSGSLPPGLTLDASTGVISGTPTLGGAYSFTITVVDSTSSNASVPMTMAVQEANFGINISTPAPTLMSLGAAANVAATLTGDNSGLGIDWTASCATSSSFNCGSFSKTHTASGVATTFTVSSYANIGDTATITATATVDGSKTATTSTTIALPNALTITTSSHPSTTVLVSATGKPSTVPLTATMLTSVFGTGVNWTLTCGDGMNDCGSLSALATTSGGATVYTAPTAVPAGNATVTISAAAAYNSLLAVSKTFTIVSSTAPNAALTGNFVFRTEGRDSNGSVYQLVGALTGDGAGKITGCSMAFYDQYPAPGNYCDGTDANGNSSSYSLDSTGKGTITLASQEFMWYPFGNSYGAITLSVDMVSPTHALLSESDSFGSGTGTLDYQNAADVAAYANYATHLNGTYALLASGYSMNAPYTAQYMIAGALNFTAQPTGMNSAGILTLNSVVDDYSMNGVVTANGSYTSAQTPAGSYMVITDTYGFDLQGFAFSLNSATSDQVELYGYLIDASHMAVIGDNMGSPDYSFGGTLVAQPSTTPTLAGSTYAFTTTGTTTAGAQQVSGGVFTCGGSGVLDVAGGGAATTSQAITSTTCTAPSGGRATVAFTGTGSTGILNFAAYPTVDAGLKLMEIDGSGPSGAGTAWHQTASSTLNGAYASNFRAYTSTGELSYAGEVTAASGAVTGAVDASAFDTANATTTQTSDATLTGAYTTNSSGRFPYTFGISGVTSSNLGAVLYVIDSSNALILETDANSPGIGVLQLQQ